MNLNAECTELLMGSKRELAAFLCAVEESRGSEQAALAVEDWLTEFESLPVLAGFTNKDWRLVTIRAAVKLAARVVPAHAGLSDGQCVPERFHDL